MRTGDYKLVRRQKVKYNKFPTPEAAACRSTSEDKDYGSEHPVPSTNWKEKLFLLFLTALAVLNLWFILAAGPN